MGELFKILHVIGYNDCKKCQYVAMYVCVCMWFCTLQVCIAYVICFDGRVV